MPGRPQRADDHAGSERRVPRLEPRLTEAPPADLLAERSGDEGADQEREIWSARDREPGRGGGPTRPDVHADCDEEQEDWSPERHEVPARRYAPSQDGLEETPHSALTGDQPRDEQCSERRRVAGQEDSDSDDDWDRRLEGHVAEIDPRDQDRQRAEEGDTE